MTKKKWMFAIIAVVLVIGIVVAVLLATRTTGKAETVSKIQINKSAVSLTMDDATCSRGDTVKIPVYFNNNPGVMASAIEFTYNADKLKYKGYSEGTVFKNYNFTTTDNAIRFINVENADTSESGVIFYLEFKVKSHAYKGDTEIKINATDESLCNYNEEFVACKAGNAILTIQ